MTIGRVSVRLALPGSPGRAVWDVSDQLIAGFKKCIAAVAITWEVHVHTSRAFSATDLVAVPRSNVTT